MSESIVYNNLLLGTEFQLRSVAVPNGRSGGFIIEKADLERPIKAMPEAIGARVGLGVNPIPRPIDASEM
jgi:hypothetical protein